MNTPSPLVPQGTMPDRGKSHIRIAVFTILAIHVVLLSALLIAGCKKTSTDTSQQDQVVQPPVMPPPDLPPPPSAATNPPPTGVTGNQLVGGTTPLPPPDTTPVTPPPPPPTPDNVAPPAGFSEHTIIKGETFGVLAKRYGVTTKAIEAANPGVNPTRLKIGQKVKIPPPKPAGNGRATANGVIRETGEKIYTVKSGDNLLKIAKAHGVTAKQIRSHNGLPTDQIRVGQKLKIPVKAPAPPPTEAIIPPPVTEPPPVPPPGVQ